MARPVLALGSILALASLTPAPVPAPVPDDCRECDGRGVVACDEHDDEVLAAEGRVLFCSVVAHCAACAGALVVDCEDCEEGTETAAMAGRRAAVAEWMASTPIEEHFGRPVPRCETEHFELVVDLVEEVRDGRERIDPHRLMHLVADDTSHVGRLVAEHYDVGEDDLFAKMRMWVWEDPDDHVSAVETFMNTSARGDFKMLGRDPVFSVWKEPGLFATAEALRTVFTHNAGHMLVSNLFRERDVGPIGGGWFDAGAGHWYEYDRFGASLNYCIEEATARTSFANGVWRAAMRKLLDREDERKIPALLDVPTTAMNVEQQAVCWSFYDWLVANHRAALRPILRDLKQERPVREIFEEHLGMGVLEAEEAWRAWVDETYPRRERTKRR